MARVYREQREYPMPDKVTLWKAESLAREALGETIRMPNGERNIDVRAEAGEEYAAHGDDFDTVLAELRSDALEPTYTSTHFYGWHWGSLEPSAVRADLVFGHVRVEIVGDNEGAVRALAAKVDRLVEPLADERQANTLTAPEKSPDTEGWLRRTWRDHAASMVVTVVGGLIVVIVAAWAFGLGT